MVSCNEFVSWIQENVEKLRGMLSDLEEEFEMQKTSKKILEELKDGLIRELTFLRLVLLSFYLF